MAQFNGSIVAAGAAERSGQSLPARDLTPPEVARIMKVKPGKVNGWINSGQLEAYNVSAATRPRWRITPEALHAFRQKRANKGQAVVKKKRRHHRKSHRQWV